MGVRGSKLLQLLEWTNCKSENWHKDPSSPGVSVASLVLRVTPGNDFNGGVV